MVAGCARLRECSGCLCRGLVTVCDEAEGFGSACAGCDEAEGAAGLGIVLATKGRIGTQGEIGKLVLRDCSRRVCLRQVYTGMKETASCSQPLQLTTLSVCAR